MLRHRDRLGEYLNQVGLTGTGVEVGVARGDFAATLLSSWWGERLILVDPWRAQPRADYVDVANVPDEQQNEHRRAVETLCRRDPRARMHEGLSEQVATTFDDGSLDFVYLDGNHAFGPALADLRAWWPKVRPGGLFAGHDYLDGYLPGTSDWHSGTLVNTRSAVDLFARNVGRAASYTVEDGPFLTWYWRKPRGPLPRPDELTVLSAFTPNVSYGPIAKANHARYCARHGYRYVCRESGFDPSRAPPWSKIRFLLEELRRPGVAWVCWIDADALFMHARTPLVHFIDDTVDLVMARDEVYGINTGVLLIRNTPWAAEFLERVWAQEQFLDHVWWENMAVIHLYDHSGDVRRKTALVPHRLFDSYPVLGHYGPDDLIAHFPGIPNRDPFIQNYAALADERWKAEHANGSMGTI